MNVVAFPPRPAQGTRSWTARELEALVAVYEAHWASGDAAAWDIGATEFEDPQFFILGPAPDLDCVMAISRVGSIYVLENGAGEVLTDTPSLGKVVAAATTPIGAKKSLGLAGRLMLALAAVRLAVEERLEPVLAESEELLIRVAPQLAAYV